MNRETNNALKDCNCLIEINIIKTLNVLENTLREVLEELSVNYSINVKEWAANLKFTMLKDEKLSVNAIAKSLFILTKSKQYYRDENMLLVIDFAIDTLTLKYFERDFHFPDIEFTQKDIMFIDLLIKDE